MSVGPRGTETRIHVLAAARSRPTVHQPQCLPVGKRFSRTGFVCKWFYLAVKRVTALTYCYVGEPLNTPWGTVPMAQRFSAAFSPGCDPGGPGSSPTLGSLHRACFSLYLCLCLSLCF